MSAGDVGLIDPTGAWSALSSQRDNLLIDVRTRAEWTFVGCPDLQELGKNVVLIEWQSFPSMAQNERFGEMALGEIEKVEAAQVFFICRSGARSMSAAQATLAEANARGRDIACFNVVEGFEGDLDAEGKRGRHNGWKARGLPWRQN